MDTLNAELADFRTIEDLKPILASQAPCLSIYMSFVPANPTPNARPNAVEWKDTVRSLEKKIEQSGGKGRELVASIADWDSVSQRQKPPHARSFSVFRSPDVLRATWMDSEVVNRVFVGPRFYIRPLLAELTRLRDFALLALSQKNVRLLHCTTRTSEEVSFPNDVIPSYDAWMNSAKPDHVLDNKATGGPSTGHMKGVMFGTSSDREDKDEYLAHFYKQIDRGVDEVLRGTRQPLVLCGVEYELALYRSVNTYPHLLEEAVQGAPNGLKSGEMHARALEALEREYNRDIDAKLAEWNHKVGGGGSNRLEEAVPAAFEGRVVTLLVSDSIEKPGTFDETTYTMKGPESGTVGDEDLVNDAAVQTILHAGQVLVVPNSKMPDGAPLAAIYRF